MDAWMIAILALCGSCGGMLLTMMWRHRLPPHHEQEETRDLLKIAVGVMATLVALILGMLVGSAKGTFDTANAAIAVEGAKVIELNRVLLDYGPETQPVRAAVRDKVVAMEARIWPASGRPDTASLLRDADGERSWDDVLQGIRRLEPGNAIQEHLKSRALQLAGDISVERWLLFEQMQAGLPLILLLVLITWVFLLFIGLGLIAPRNSTAAIALLACALSMSGAIFLIVELTRPLDGWIQVSKLPVVRALQMISK